MIHFFLGPFLQNEFMARALAGGLLVSLSCAVVGTFVVLRGLAFGTRVALGKIFSMGQRW